jgi:hypothetical protein
VNIIKHLKVFGGSGLRNAQDAGEVTDTECMLGSRAENLDHHHAIGVRDSFIVKAHTRDETRFITHFIHSVLHDVFSVMTV